jgi:hypothetical protein
MALLMNRYSQKVQCFRVIRLHREDLAVERLGFGQSVRLVMLERELESLLDGHHASAFSAHQRRHMAR